MFFLNSKQKIKILFKICINKYKMKILVSWEEQDDVNL